jgi:hypothetical protein
MPFRNMIGNEHDSSDDDDDSDDSGDIDDDDDDNSESDDDDDGQTTVKFIGNGRRSEASHFAITQWRSPRDRATLSARVNMPQIGEQRQHSTKVIVFF